MDVDKSYFDRLLDEVMEWLEKYSIDLTVKQRRMAQIIKNLLAEATKRVEEGNIEEADTIMYEITIWFVELLKEGLQ